MPGRRSLEEYREHAHQVEREHGFVPTFPDYEGRKINARGLDTTKLWLGEVIDTIKFVTFEIPTSSDPSTVTYFGSENSDGKLIDPRFPFGEFSITRITNSPEPDQVIVTLEIYMHESEKAKKFVEAFNNEMFSITDITGSGRAKFFSRFEQGVELTHDRELPASLLEKVEKPRVPLFSSIKTSRIYNLGDRTEEFLLAEKGMFALENAA